MRERNGILRPNIYHLSRLVVLVSRSFRPASPNAYIHARMYTHVCVYTHARALGLRKVRTSGKQTANVDTADVSDCESV